MDFALIARLAEVYRAVRYEDRPADVRRAVEASYEQVEVVDLAGTQNRYLLGTVPGGRRQEIVVRGTANVRNAVLDAEVAKSWNAELETRLHAGFERAALAVYKDVRPRLADGAEVVLFGHSLGAAEAVILGMLLTRDGRRVTAIYASGQPKVTNAAGAARWSDLPVLRMSCEGDPIPLLPPRIALSRDPFVHFGPEILLLDGASWVAVPGRYAEEARLVEVLRILRSGRVQEAIRLHLFAPNYLEKYRAKAAGGVELPFDELYRTLR